MITTKDYDFSFSGLKTAVLYDWQKRSAKVQKSPEYIGAMAYEIQHAIVEVLVAKTMRAAAAYQAKTIVLGGGVASNKELRKQLRYKIQDTNYKLLVAPPTLCTDNGAMVAVAGYATWLRRTPSKRVRLEAAPHLTFR